MTVLKCSEGVHMIKVITYGSFDLLHEGHIRLLKRARALGDHLTVGVTTDDFDRSRGKINVRQSLMERIESVRSLNIADEIIIEEYEGQKIDDIQRLNIDLFVIGSDWTGRFDYLREYCQVIYLPRTEGISSTELRNREAPIRLGITGGIVPPVKPIEQSRYINGLMISGLCVPNPDSIRDQFNDFPITDDYSGLLDKSDAVYISSDPAMHYKEIRQALEKGLNVLCRTPIAVKLSEYDELQALAHSKGLLIVDAIKTAYCQAYSRLLLLLKSGIIGEILSVDSTCTSLKDPEDSELDPGSWNSLCLWGIFAMLPVFQILGTDYVSKHIYTRYLKKETCHDGFTKIEFVYPHAVASIKSGQNVKSEGELVVSGTLGYVYVPAPWWKTDYFEVRFEDQTKNRRYFYQLDGDGVRYELLTFANSVRTNSHIKMVDENVSRAIVKIVEDFYAGNDLTEI